jgi:hypothetical protein
MPPNGGEICDAQEPDATLAKDVDVHVVPIEASDVAGPARR